MNIVSFFAEMFGNVAVVIDNGTPWFYAKDVCDVLGYQNSSRSVKQHTFEEDRMLVPRPENTQNYQNGSSENREEITRVWGAAEQSNNPRLFVNESGLYCLIFGSKKPAAREFKQWITATVLPAIRKNGGYIAQQEALSEEEQKDLIAEVRKLSSKVAYLQKRRHEVLADNRKLKSQLSVAKYNYNDYAKLLEGMYGILLKDFQEMYAKLKARQTPSASVEPAIDEQTIYVDRNGFLTTREWIGLDGE